MFHGSLLFLYTATISDAFGVGEGPTLLFNVTCNHTHLNLSQCVHPESIGLRDCVSQDKRAGVICPEMAAIISPSTSYTMHSIEPSTTIAPLSHNSITSSFSYSITAVTDFGSRSSTSSTDVYSMTTLVLTTVSTCIASYNQEYNSSTNVLLL